MVLCWDYGRGTEHLNTRAAKMPDEIGIILERLRSYRNSSKDLRLNFGNYATVPEFVFVVKKRPAMLTS